MTDLQDTLNRLRIMRIQTHVALQGELPAAVRGALTNVRDAIESAIEAVEQESYVTPPLYDIEMFG